MAAPDLDQLRGMMDQAQRSLRTLQEARERVEEVTGEAASADGLISATCRGHGTVTGLVLDPRAMRRDRETLSRDVTAVLQAAQRDAELQAGAIVGQALDDTADLPEPPDASAVLDRVEQAARDILGA
ncbi:YbaB/EbfC family nucleoid-associated protein [Microtetraspora sp. NBRC 13810]|uniref:YbaB/EbfC family nucleoid-associated protein n=1 Tax=Microtetraspora sp. NBRC 13810 TaxID=3030990 RepID=UPI002557706F|nr:YbaB/EbfC family nucleoid-associated protein [Microtetraspora sp. NBRC 13810]